MADNVQWLKFKVGMFDGNSFKKIKRVKIGGVPYRDKLTAVWFELLDLAGKSNANGCLIDNNEMPYHSFEDIAIMIDREEKEVELCMQFFISEKMVEIIDDIYCLTNFAKYQNQDGLERIREQKRVAQAKWRERKKQGLVGFVDEKTSTSTSTHNLPSNSISNSYSNSISNNIENNNNKEKEILKKSQSSEKELIDSFEFPEDVKNTIYDWLSYKKEKHQSYKPTGLKTLLKKLKEDCNTNGDEYVIKSIEYSMTSNYSGIFAPRQDFNKSSFTSQKKTNTSNGYEVI